MADFVLRVLTPEQADETYVPRDEFETLVEGIDTGFNEAEVLDIAYKTLAPTFYGSLAGLRDTKVVPVVIAGASVAAGITTDRWPYMFNQRLQAAYPRAVGGEQAIRTLATAVATPPTGTGAVVINAAVGGTRTDTFLTSTTRTQVMNLKPALVIIADMPANDYGAGVLPSAVKANMITQLTDLIAKQNPSFPCQYVVVGGYYPTIASPAAPSADYRKAMKEAVAMFPGKAVWIDTYDDWIAMGVGSGLTDPLDFLLADNLHPNANGHKVLADSVTRLFRLPDGIGTVSVTAPLVTTAALNTFITGTAANQTLAASGTAPITWSVVTGAFPTGVSMNSSGIISGTPSATGAYSVTVRATNAAGTNDKVYSGTTAAALVAPTVTTTTLGTTNTAVPITPVVLAATGSTPITWDISAGALPAGLTLSGDTISGTPTTAGAYSVTVRATNAAGNNTKVLSGSVTDVVITPTVLTSDGFTGSGTMSGRVADLTAGGGTAKTWIVGAGTWTVASGVMKPATSATSGAVLIDTGVTNNVQVSAKLAAWVSGTSNYVELFRTGASTNAYMLGIGPAGTLTLSQSSTGTIQTFSDTAASLVGKRLMIRYFNGILSAWVDTTKIYEAAATASGGTMAGFSKTSTASDISWDDFRIETLV